MNIPTTRNNTVKCKLIQHKGLQDERAGKVPSKPVPYDINVAKGIWMFIFLNNLEQTFDTT